MVRIEKDPTGERSKKSLLGFLFEEAIRQLEGTPSADTPFKKGEHIVNIFSRKTAEQKNQQPIKNEAKNFAENTKDSTRPLSEVAEIKTNYGYQYSKKIPAGERMEFSRGMLSKALAENTGDAAWLGITGPEDIQHSPEAAQFAARILSMSPDLRNDPNVLYQELVSLSCSRDSSMSAEALAEYTKYLNLGINRLEALRTDPSAKGILALSREDVIRTTRGLVLHDPALEQIHDANLRKGLEYYQTMLDDLEQASGGNFEDIRKNKLETLAEQIAEGSLVIKENGQDVTLPIDAQEKKKYLQRISKRLSGYREGHEQQMWQKEQERYRARSLEGQKYQTAEEVWHAIDQHSMRFTGVEEIPGIVENLAPSEREEFIKVATRKLRKKIELLEASDKRWDIGGIEPLPSDLLQILSSIQVIDVEAHKTLYNEAKGRAWLHRIYQAIRQGASPYDFKNILMETQEFDSMEIHEALVNIPGVSEAFKLIDKRGRDLIAAEVHQDKYKAIMKEIMDEIRTKKDLKGNLICDPKTNGISADTAVELALRHYHETGRDAAKYREWLRYNRYITYVQEKDKHGHVVTVGKIDPNAPILWNAMRLLYCPESIETFFQYGANMKGDQKNIMMVTFDRFGNRREKQFEATMGQGVGADVMRMLLANKFDLLLQDYYSRRKDYILSGWSDSFFDHEPKNLTPDQLRIFHEDKKIWERNIQGDIRAKDMAEDKFQVLANNASSVRDAIAFIKKVEFAEQFGVPVWGGKPSSPDKVNAIISQALERKNIPDASYAQNLKDRYAAAMKSAEAINKKQLENFKDIRGEQMDNGGTWDFFPTLENYDISKVEHMSTRRLHEVFRGNMRDHGAGLEMLQLIGDFINDPSLDNLMKLDIHKMKGYASFPDTQVRYFIPAFLAFGDVQRGTGPLGYEITSLIDIFKSKYSKVFDVKSLTELDLYKIARLSVTKGYLTRDVMFKMRGGFGGRVRDEILQNADPVSAMILFLSVFQEEAKKMEKDLEKG